MTAWERAGWGLVACCLLGAVAFRPALRTVRPDVAVAACLLDDSYAWLVPRRTAVDPWGTPWGAVDVPGPDGRRTWSAGPDRIHDTADDVQIIHAILWWVHPTAPTWATLAMRGSELLTLAAVAISWCLAAPFRRSPRATLTRELARTAVLASVPAATGALALDWYLRTAWWQELDRVDLLLVPWRVAAGGSVALLCGLAALAWRLRALPGPAEPPGRGDHQKREPRQDDVDLRNTESPGAQEHDRRDGGAEEHGRGGPDR